MSITENRRLETGVCDWTPNSKWPLGRLQLCWRYILSCPGSDEWKRNLCAGMPIPRPFIISFLLPSWRAVRSYRPHLKKRDPITAMTGFTALMIWSPCWGFSQPYDKCQEICVQPRDHFIIILTLATDVTDTTLGTSGIWLGIRTGAGGTATLAWSFFFCSPWFHEHQLNIMGFFY